MTYMHKLAHRLAILRTGMIASALVAGACVDMSRDPSSPANSTQIVVSPKRPSASPQQTLQLAAAAIDELGDTVVTPISWTATGGQFTSVATAAGVSYAQYVAPNTDGVYRVIASGGAGIKPDTSIVTVGSVSVASVVVSPSTSLLTPGGTVQLTATPRDASNNPLAGRTVTWSSNATGVATVSGSGLATAVATGTATIAATSEGKSGSSTITVIAPGTGSEAEPTFSSPVDRGVWQDNFDRYTSYASMGDALAQTTYGLRTGDGFGYNPVHQALVTSGRSGNAIRSILLDDPQHLQQGSNWASPVGSGAITRPAASDTVVFSFWFRTSPGGSPQPYGNKWFEWWPVGGSDRTQVGLVGSQMDYQGVNHSMLWRLNAAGRTTSGPGSAYQVRGPYWDQVNDGQWHRWTLMYRSNTVDNYPSAGSRDGIVRVWVDGTKVMDCSAESIGITPPRGVRPWCIWEELDTVRSYAISYALWPGTHNGTDHGYTIDYDDFQWWVEHGP